MASGTRHRTEFVDGGKSWQCSCGDAYRPPLFTARSVVAVLPSLVAAPANLHVHGRGIPR